MTAIVIEKGNQMGRISRVILFQNAVETLGYFSKQLAAGLEHCGLAVYIVDYERIEESMNGCLQFVKKGMTALLTFNFIGLSGEPFFLDEKGKYLWEKYEMQYLNILVDHPMYFHKKILQKLPCMHLFCIDREHAAYIRRFYPQTPVQFLPLAGNEGLHRQMEYISFEKRKFELVFTGNYVPLAQLEEKINQQEADYRIFYHEIIEELLLNPMQSVDCVMEKHIKSEIAGVGEADLCAAMSGMILIDLYVRTYLREKIFQKLAEAEINIHLFGADWDKMSCINIPMVKKHIISNDRQLSSAECAQIMGNSKISLNVLPWFRDGAHDRVFTAMLQHTVSLTDESLYLHEQMEENSDIVFYSLRRLEKLPDLVLGLLADNDRAEQIAQNGWMKASAKHTWENRAQNIWMYLEKL